MAERRMFAKKIIDSARFIKMPLETQSFYFHLGVRADDDGIVEAFSVMRLLGVSEDSLKILVAKGFVTVLNDDLVSHITDWKEHNLIRADRKVDSIYKNLLLQLLPDVNLIEKRDRADRKHDENTRDDNGTSMGQHSIVEDSIGKVSIGEYKDTMSGKPNPSLICVDVISYLNSKAGTNYRQHIKKTIGLVKARTDEGFTLDDFKTVIDKQCALWKNDPKMSAYLRPDTLFGTKFEGYLNATASTLQRSSNDRRNTGERRHPSEWIKEFQDEAQKARDEQQIIDVGVLG